jgi:hypothetical protein
VADDEEASVLDAFLGQFLLDLNEEGYVLFDGEAADKAEHTVTVLRVAAALGGMKKLGIDAAGHEVTGAAGAGLKQRAEFGIGSEEDAGDGVELGGGGHGEVFDFLAGGGGLALGQEAEEPTGAAGGVFMDIGVPTGGEGPVEVVGESGAQHADLAGSGDVEKIGLEALEHIADEGDVTEKSWVEAEILFEGKGKKTAGQFEGPDVSVFGECLGTISGANAEKGQIAPTGKGFEVSAGVGHAVDFVKRVGKVGDARGPFRHFDSELPICMSL